MADGNYNGGQQQSTRDYHAIGDFRQALTAPPQPTATKQPRLSVYFHKNKVFMDARTNVPADMNTQERGIIRCEMDPPIFFTFLAAFERVIVSKEPVAERIKILRPDYRKQNGGNPVLDTTVLFGRDKDGVVFLSLLSWNKERPMIKFPFHPGKFAEFVGRDGNPASDVDVSNDVAMGYLKQWQQLVPMYMFHRYVAEQFDRTQQRGGQNGQQSENNQQNNQQSGGDMRTDARSSTTDQGWENIPF